MNIGILPVTVSEGFLHNIFSAIEQDPQAQIEVDLPSQVVTIISTNEKESFDINGYKKNNLINGFDDIDFLHNISAEIKSFAEKTVY
jgi:3-isopropylmalate/(R)-2-methylmalate dehydratase small subunit